jgi:alpha-beta hydrolase superfamily lysophospholipase
MIRFVPAAAALMAATSVHAQTTERAVFLVRLGSDTIAVERASRSGAQVEGRLLIRSPALRMGQQVTLNSASTVERVVTTLGLGATGDSVQQRAELTFHGDSATSHVEDTRAPVPVADRQFSVARGVIPFVNLSGLSLELILRRARAIGGDMVQVPVLLLGGQGLTATVTRVGADSAIVSLGGIALRARTDSAGRLLGAAVPSQHVVFERLAGDSPVAAWHPVTVSYAAPDGAPYTAEELTVRTPAGLRLAGTLTLPKRPAGTRVPAVVLITGSGAQDRDEGTPFLEHWRPFREIADTLSRRGIAVLRLDDRGVGGSDAGPATATSADYADDIRAALAWLRTRPEIDSTRLGLVGHSEGAIIAPMVAAGNTRLRGIVLIAGTASRGRDILAGQRRYLFGRDTTLSAGRRDSLMAAASREADSAYAAPGWMHFFADYEPLPTARKVRVPVLILQGETDRQVPVSEARTLAAAMRAAGNRRVTLRTFPTLNHLLVEDPSGNPIGYTKLPSHAVRKDLLGAVADWLARTL